MGTTLEKMRNGFLDHARVGRGERRRIEGLTKGMKSLGKAQSEQLPDLQAGFAELLACLNVDASAPFFWTLVYLMFYTTFKECDEEDDDDDDNDEDDYTYAPQAGGGRGRWRWVGGGARDDGGKGLTWCFAG